MVSKRKFYKTTITVEILSESDPSSLSLDNMLQVITFGEDSGMILDEKIQVIDGKETAQRLVVHGSDPEFFQLDENGNDLNGMEE